MSLREQNIGDRAIDTANFNALVRAVRKLLSIAWDPAFFSVRDTGGSIQITMRNIAAPLVFSGVVFAVGKMWIGKSDSDEFTSSTDRSMVTSNDKRDYVYIPFDGSAPTWSDGPLVNRDPDGEWYYIPETYGDIHVSRA